MTNEKKGTVEAAREAKDEADRLFRLFQEGRISSKEFRLRARGYVIRDARGRRNYSKWSTEELREIRRRNGVGRPPHVYAERQRKLLEGATT